MVGKDGGGIMSPCCLCNGTGTSQPDGCPSCGRKLPPNPAMAAMLEAHERLEVGRAVGEHPCLSWRLEDDGNTRAKVMVGGEIIAVATDRDPATAIRLVADLALRQVEVRCGCGIVSLWAELELRGVQEMPWGERCELRNCPCGSTLSVCLDPGNWDAHEYQDIHRDPDGVVEELMKRSA